MVKTLVYIGLGSCLGGISRYLLSNLIQTDTGGFPFGTITVNILGCFLMGIICGLCERNGLMGSNLQMFLTVGFCGGFTTFSTFINENYNLLAGGQILHLVLYPTLSFGLGMLAAHLGNILVR